MFLDLPERSPATKFERARGPHGKHTRPAIGISLGGDTQFRTARNSVAQVQILSPPDQ
jgi:hypothetical protein